MVARNAGTGAVVGTGYASSYTAGRYTVLGLAPGNYTVDFQPYSDSAYVAEFYDDAATAADAEVLTITGSSLPGIDATLAIGPTVTGRIADAGGTGVAGACAALYRADSTYLPLRQTCAGDDGRYTLRGVPVGNYLLRFSSTTGGLVDTWYGGGLSAADASVLAVPAGGASGIDGRLVTGGSISGAVTSPEGGQVCVMVQPVTGTGTSASTCQSVAVGGTFRYTTSTLPAGDYRVHWSDAANRASRYYPDARSWSGAQAVTVTAGAVTSGIDGALPALVQMSGRLTDAATGAGVTGTVSLGDTDPDAVRHLYGSGWAYAGPGGSWTTRVEPGTYVLTFSATGYQTQFWQGATSQDEATRVTVSATDPAVAYDATLSGGGAQVSGTLRDETGTPLSGICVRVQRASAGEVCTGPDGSYRTTIPAGTYYEGYPDASPLSTYDPAEVRATVGIPLTGMSDGQLTVRNGDQILGLDAVVPSGARLAIAVTADNNGSPVGNVCASLQGYPAPGGYFCTTNGTLISGPLLPGSYSVQLTNPAGRYAAEYYDDVVTLGAAMPVALAPGATRSLQAGLSLGGGLAGTLSLPDGAPAAGRCVAITPVDRAAGDSITACADAVGVWSSPGLRPGGYVVGSTASGAVPTWYPGQGDAGDATPVVVQAGRTTSGVDFTLLAAAPTSSPSGSTTTATATSSVTSTTATTTTSVSTTSQPPGTTTSAPPVTTSQAPTTTTSPVTTSQPPVTTAPVTTSQPPVRRRRSRRPSRRSRRRRSRRPSRRSRRRRSRRPSRRSRRRRSRRPSHRSRRCPPRRPSRRPPRSLPRIPRDRRPPRRWCRAR